MRTIEEFIKELVEESISRPVVVEGKKDEAALKKLGVHNVHQLSQKPLFSFVEEISKTSKGVILLLDNDREGRKLFKRLLQGFSRMGLQVDRRFARAMRKLRISHVEGIRGCENGENGVSFSKIHNPRKNKNNRRG